MKKKKELKTNKLANENKKCKCNVRKKMEK